MLVAVTSTEVGAVHKLRTSTRRVQAHLALLDLLSTSDSALPVPPHKQETAAVLRRLKRVRRAAGAVRDLDVQTGTIQMDAPQKAAVHKGTSGDTIRKQARQLRKHLESNREAEARRLVRVLQAEEHPLAAELQALEQAIQTVKGKALAAAGLIDRVQLHFTAGVKGILRPGKADLPRAIEALHEDDLHAVRKLAKLSRYMLESAPEGSRALAVAERYEALQEAGGRWHDWLLLQQISARFHGRKAELTQRYATHAASELAEYRLRLTELLPALQK